MRPVTVGLLTLLMVASAGAQGRYGPGDSSAPLGDLDLKEMFPPTGGATSPSPAPSGADSRFGSATGPTAGSPAAGNPLRQPSAPAQQPLTPPQRSSPPSTFQPLNTNTRPLSSSTSALSSPATPPSRQPQGGQGFANNALGPASPNTGAATPALVMMQQMLASPGDSQLAGSPLTLAEVVAGAASRAEQSQRIDAYWDLCSSVADYYLGLREAEELSLLIQRAPAISGALRQAENELRVRLGTSQRAAVATQQRLASLMGRSSLGLPGDLPFCGRYGTKYDAIFPGGGPSEATQLDALIPLRYAELVGAAEAVVRSEQFVTSVASRSTQSSDGILRALELLALNRRAFVQIARDYNRRITRYTELSRPGRLDNGRLVAMLIGPSETRLTSATGEGRSNSSGVTFRSPQAGAGVR